mmetsp:Transcript_23045/g.71773  ORF Transcript_23045/g.71773 Transcript_23045/m.71773 type:complete len:232 (+) Transcript_23045:3304-3999(+)
MAPTLRARSRATLLRSRPLRVFISASSRSRLRTMPRTAISTIFRMMMARCLRFFSASTMRLRSLVISRLPPLVRVFSSPQLSFSRCSRVMLRKYMSAMRKMANCAVVSVTSSNSSRSSMISCNDWLSLRPRAVSLIGSSFSMTEPRALRASLLMRAFAVSLSTRAGGFRSRPTRSSGGTLPSWGLGSPKSQPSAIHSIMPSMTSTTMLRASRKSRSRSSTRFALLLDMRMG